MRNFEPRAALALICVGLLLGLVGGPGHVRASGISGPVVLGWDYYGPTPIVACDFTAAFSAPGNATTLLVGGIAGQTIYVCGFAFTASVENTTKFVRGTGVTCGTGTADVTGPYTAANRVIALGANLGFVLSTQPSDDLCLSATNAGSVVNGLVSFTVF